MIEWKGETELESSELLVVAVTMTVAVTVTNIFWRGLSTWRKAKYRDLGGFQDLGVTGNVMRTVCESIALYIGHHVISTLDRLDSVNY